MRTPCFIDTDPGVDDALAILFALANRLDVPAITTVYGNTTVEQTTINALTILELMKQNIPVFSGEDRPLSVSPRLAKSHGDNGFGGFKLDNLTRNPDPEEAVGALARMIQEREACSIACLGPLTNIARLCERYPSSLACVDSLIIMGGVFDELGNVSQFAEFNVYNDPHALEIALRAPIRNKVLIPANVCRKVQCTKQDFDVVGSGRLAEQLKQIVDIYIRYYQTEPEYGGFTGGVMYDLLTIAYVLDPTQFTVRPSAVSVNCTDAERRGETTIIPDASPNCLLVTDVDAESIRQRFLDALRAV